jgi:transcriptional regulator with XRE-family HTH domain
MDAIGTFAGSLVRAARRAADLSQRQLADRSGVPRSTIGAAEAGTRDLPFDVLVRLLRVCRWELMAVDEEDELHPVVRDQHVLDRGGRRYPAHLDVRALDKKSDLAGFWPIDDWWGDRWAGAWGIPPRPGQTFDLQRPKRDRRRRTLDGHYTPIGWRAPTTTSAPEGRNP